MIETKIFTGTRIANAKIATLRRKLGQRKVTCDIVFDTQSAPAAAYAARLVALGAQAGINVRELDYSQTTQHPALFLEPAPAGVDIASLISTLGAAQDAEGLHPLNLGKLTLGVHHIAPPTAQAAQLVTRHLAGTLIGKKVTIVGASRIVGLPLAQLMIHEGATVRIAQESTSDLSRETHDADIVISATGVPELIKAKHIADGAIVVDIGITLQDGRLVGDVDQASVLGKAAVVTHVPDGVGPVTAACLFENIVAIETSKT
jgi:methylenetetrahydrofolate dehydrogenase (NADP+)/methenyltetrahydrofolate cyclohydrolase